MQGLFRLSLLIMLLSGCGSSTERDEPQAAGMPPDMHTSRISLDWPGTYVGTLPCADCPGIRTVITLQPDGQFMRQRIWLDRHSDAVIDRGTFEWTEDGGSIVLGNEQQRYLVGERVLIQRDRDGNAITGDLAAHYRLEQTDE